MLARSVQAGHEEDGVVVANEDTAEVNAYMPLVSHQDWQEEEEFGAFQAAGSHDAVDLFPSQEAQGAVGEDLKEEATPRQVVLSLTVEEVKQLEMPDDQVQTIKSMMQSMPWPEHAVPPWAKQIPESSWMPHVVTCDTTNSQGLSNVTIQFGVEPLSK